MAGQESDPILAQYGGHTSTGAMYGVEGAKDYAVDQHQMIKKLVFDPLILEFLEAEGKGKRVLDVGCGFGYYSVKSSEVGAKKVLGFDFDKEMVTRAKAAAAACDNVDIVLGDAASMPCGDGEYDTAISLYVCNNLSTTAFDKHFKELYRVLAPGGKALITVFLGSLYNAKNQRDQESGDETTKRINAELAKLPGQPTSKDIREVLTKCELGPGLAITVTCSDDNKYFVVQGPQDVRVGQPLWAKGYGMICPTYFYSRDHYDNAIKAAGLNLDKNDNALTKERLDDLIATQKDEKILKIFELVRKMSDNPPLIFYYLSKPATA